ncbi:MAG TPA: OmpA family protein, partial [Gammaproteobacteria bacterium]
MDLTQQWRKLLGTLLLTVAAVPVAGAAEPAAINIPAFPAALNSDCANAECPDTLHTAHEITFISRLAFPLGSAMLTREAKNELLRMLVELESFAVIKQVEIVGHADPSGPENYNRWISEVRAKRVQDYFAQSGVDPRKVTLRAAGSAEPLIGAIDPSEHRRVEVR